LVRILEGKTQNKDLFPDDCFDGKLDKKGLWKDESSIAGRGRNIPDSRACGNLFRIGNYLNRAVEKRIVKKKCLRGRKRFEL